MRIRALWQTLLAIASITLIASMLTHKTATPATKEIASAKATRTPEPTRTPLPEGVAVCTEMQPAPGGWYVEGVIGSPLYPNPILADSNPVDQHIVDLVFDGLVELDEFGRPQPALAESWRVLGGGAGDGTTIRFNLRSNVRWHDGEQFTARDVAFTYGLMQDAPWESVGIRIVNDFVIDFTLPQPYAPFVEATSRGILPRHLFLDGVPDLSRSSFNNRPVGTGRFVAVTNWARDGILRLVPNPVYWEDEIQLDGVEMRFFANDSSRMTAFVRGDIHALLDVEPEMIPLLSEQENIRMVTSAETIYTQLLFNFAEGVHPAVQAYPFRQAIAHATDRAALIDTLFNGQAIPFDGPYLPNSWAYSDAVTVYEPSMTRATALISETGLITETTTLTILAIQQAQDREVIAELQAQWEPLGFTVTPQFLDSIAYLRALELGDWDMVLLTVDPLADPDLYNFWSQPAIVDGQNYGKWDDVRASEALERGRQIWDRGERYPHYIQFLSRFDDALPAVSLFQRVQTYALSGEVTGANIGRVITPHDRFDTIPQWTVEEEEVDVACEG